MESKITIDQNFQEIQNYLNRAQETSELARAEAHLRVAERKLRFLEDRLLSDPFHTDEQLYALVAFKRGAAWNVARNHVVRLSHRVAA